MCHSSSYPLLIIPALGECSLWYQQADGRLVPPPEVQPHLDIAQPHTKHGEQVGQQEEYNIVPEISQI